MLQKNPPYCIFFPKFLYLNIFCSGCICLSRPVVLPSFHLSFSVCDKPKLFLSVFFPTLSISVLVNLDTKAVRGHRLEAASASSFCIRIKPRHDCHVLLCPGAQMETLNLSLCFGMLTLGCKDL